MAITIEEKLSKYIKNTDIKINQETITLTTELKEQELKNIINTINKENSDYSLTLISCLKNKATLKLIKNQDHRQIGEQLNIFGFNSLMGSGIPYWLENGLQLKQTITSYVNYIQKKHGITLVSTPELGKKELYKASGHWEHYQENIFPPIKLDKNDEYILRPMTCPHHILLYKKQKWHEKNLPISLGENARLYRYEWSGGLFGLERTRCMELIDTHIFCTKEQLNNSLQQALNIVLEIKKTFNIEYTEIILALRDKNKEKFFNDDNLWKTSETILKNFLDKNEISYQIKTGDAAFYGPKIDFQIKTFNEKIITISTIQLDFLLPKKFDLYYLTDESGTKNIPIMIHLGIIGTLERFIAYLLERDNGWLPFWLSPIQVSIIPINPNKHLKGANKLAELCKQLNLRISIESSNESLGKRITKVIKKKSYSYIVVGDKEMEEINDINLNDIKNKSLFNWNKFLDKLTITKNQNKSDSHYPENYIEFLRWASLSHV